MGDGRHMGHGWRRGLTTAAAGLLAVGLTAGSARSADTAESAYSATTGVGVHNAYEKGTYPYFADALDSGAALLELDVWTNVFGSSWRVSHSNPIGNDNNCENAANASQLRTKARNQNLAGCLADIKAWHDAHPGHRPVVLKLELKDGFQANNGRGPAQLDALLSDKLGSALFRPADLAGDHATLDEAVRAAWLARPVRARRALRRGADPRDRRRGQPRRHAVDRSGVRHSSARSRGGRSAGGRGRLPRRAPGRGR